MVPAMLFRPSTDWRFWAGGLLVSLAACCVCPVDDMQYGYSGLLAVLFFWGLLRSDECTIGANEELL